MADNILGMRHLHITNSHVYGIHKKRHCGRRRKMTMESEKNYLRQGSKQWIEYRKSNKMPTYLRTQKCLSLQWRHNGRDGVSNHQPRDWLLNRLFRRRPNKTSKLRVTGLCTGNSTVTGEFPAKMASNAEYVSIGWRHHACVPFSCAIIARTFGIDITRTWLMFRPTGSATGYDRNLKLM